MKFYDNKGEHEHKSFQAQKLLKKKKKYSKNLHIRNQLN